MLNYFRVGQINTPVLSSWTQRLGQAWQAVACSADGTSNLIAASAGTASTYMYTASYA